MENRGLTRQANKLIQQNPPLNKKYPERRNKPKTDVTDFQSIEAKGALIGDSEREALFAISTNPSEEVRLMTELNFLIDRFPNDEKVILQRRQEGWTQQEIATYLNKPRRQVIRIMDRMYKKFTRRLK